MIHRFVKMTFQQDKTEEFIRFFEENKDRISAFEGCDEVHLYQDHKSPHVFFTYSLWHTEQDLYAYRTSDFFKNTWVFVKTLFEGRAEAWSTSEIARTP